MDLGILHHSFENLVILMMTITLCGKVYKMFSNFFFSHFMNNLRVEKAMFALFALLFFFFFFFGPLTMF